MYDRGSFDWNYAGGQSVAGLCVWVPTDKDLIITGCLFLSSSFLPRIVFMAESFCSVSPYDEGFLLLDCRQKNERGKRLTTARELQPCVTFVSGTIRRRYRRRV